MENERRQPVLSPEPAQTEQPDSSIAASPVKHRHRRGLKIAIIVTLSLLLVIAGAAYAYWQSLMGNVNIINPTDETLPSEYNVPTETLANPVPQEKKIRNILLLGVDSREEEVMQSNSDTMMILTIDEINNTIKLTSLQRDMLVYEPGKDTPVKINSANTHGGPLLAMRVVNDTFRLNITNYVVVNMRGMEAIIDIAGGVTVPVEEDEVYHVNQMVGYQNYIFPETPESPLLTGPGVQLLNGRQAVAFARIRKLDNDYQRMSRQRVVIQALLDRFMAAGVGTKSQMISGGLAYITTNLNKTQLTSIGMTTVPMMKRTIEQMQIPINGYFVEDPEPVWVNRCDFNGMIPLLQQFIFGRTYPFDPVRKIPGAPNSGSTISTTRTTTRPTTRSTTEETTTGETTTSETTTGETTTSETTTGETTTSETTTGETTTGETTIGETTTGETTTGETTTGETTTGETTTGETTTGSEETTVTTASPSGTAETTTTPSESANDRGSENSPDGQPIAAPPTQ